jgi:hypothetical protein
MYASDDDDIEERYLAAEVSNTNYGRHDTVTVTGKHHGYDTNCAGFSKDVKKPHSSETHRRRENSQKCRFARHLHTLLPTLGPAVRRDDKDEDKYLAANAYGNETSRKKKGVKHARKSNMPKHGKEEACRQINMQKTCR